MSKILSKIESIIFIIFVFIILLLNIYGSIFMLASYWPCFDKNKFLIFLISIIILAGIIYFYKKAEISKKVFIIVISILTIVSLIFRLILNRSFSAYPTGDQYQIMLATNDIFNEGFVGSLKKGGYLNIYPFLSGLIPFLYIPAKLFEMEALGYYDYNAILITISFLLLTMSIKNWRGHKASLLISFLLFLFIPSYFLDFVIYGDVFSLLFISVAIFMLSTNKLKETYKIVISSLFMGLAYMARSNSVVWIIALIIAYLVYRKISFRTLLISLVSIVIFLAPSTINRKIIETTYNVDLSSNSMPTINWIYIGTGYSIDGGAGIYNPLGMDTLGNTGYDKKETSKVLKDGVNSNLKNLSKVNELALFLKRKIQNTWTDPDFETMGFVMPNDGYDVESFVNEGYRLPVGTSTPDATYTNSLGKLVYDNFTSIRNIEKVFVFEILIVIFISAYLRIKNNRFSFTSLFLELNVVGFFLLQLILETKPRYVLISFIMMIVLASYEMPLLEELFKDTKLFKKNKVN